MQTLLAQMAHLATAARRVYDDGNFVSIGLRLIADLEFFRVSDASQYPAARRKHQKAERPGVCGGIEVELHAGQKKSVYRVLLEILA